MLQIVFVLSFGAMLGDIMASLLKRRMGKERGEKALLLDQYDFVVGALLFCSIFKPRWIFDTYIDGYGPLALVTLFIIIPLLHRFVNIIGYKLDQKKEPW